VPLTSRTIGSREIGSIDCEQMVYYLDCDSELVGLLVALDQPSHQSQSNAYRTVKGPQAYFVEQHRAVCWWKVTTAYHRRVCSFERTASLSAHTLCIVDASSPSNLGNMVKHVLRNRSAVTISTLTSFLEAPFTLIPVFSHRERSLALAWKSTYISSGILSRARNQYCL
jgi:hypothetical protein